VSRQSFSLRKWYLDCVSDVGDTVIVYSAELQWHRIRLHYSSVLACRENRVITRTSMSRFEEPVVNSDEALLKLPKLGVSGSWKRLSDPVKQTIYETGDGSVEWNCFQPKSFVQANVTDIGEFRGLGYAECLTLTIAPWQLPMRELRWGRFLSADDSMVWIDWQGEHNFRFAFHNGRVCIPATITDSAIESCTGALQLDRGLSLRSGRLGDTVLRSAPALRLLPSSLFGIVEQKWRSRGKLNRPEGCSSGWSIHEVVQWNT
jgi:hypothetical protein